MTLVALLFLSLVLFSSSPENTTLTQVHCLPDQHHALIQLKQGFKTTDELYFHKTNTTKVHSWNASTDCCKWDGITCDEKTGMVTVVDLSEMWITGELNPALFNLNSLQYLNLSYNYFDNVILPKTGFERLPNLTHLDLSYSGFAGPVPSSISTLTNLISLKLSYNNFYLHDTGLKTLLNNLTKLQVLALNWVNMSLISKWDEAVFQVGPTLQELSMAYCGLSGNFPDMWITGELNPALFNLSSLRYLNLAGNNFVNISLPQTGFERLGNLTHLDLSSSGFAGQVPSSISTLTNLISLDLSYNNFYLQDTGLKTLLNNLTKLQVLALDGLNMSLISEWGQAVFHVGPSLQVLSMGYCELRGNLPDEIFHLTNLTELYLFFNPMLSGQLPEFTKQSFLQYLYLSGTNFTGPLPDSIGNLQYLSELDLSNCNFYGEIPPSITNLTRLQYLGLWSNRLTGTIPMSLFSHPSLRYLDLWSNRLTGYLPAFSNGSSILESINLGSNNLQGELPISIFKFPQLSSLYLESNNFNGTLNLDVIQHSKKLEYLYLSNNKLSIIEDNESFYADSFPQLNDLSLASCNLTKFPSFLNYLANIYSLNLSNNSLTGEIPLSHGGDSPFHLSGQLPQTGFERLGYLTHLDLSYSNFVGQVPIGISSLTNLISLYLSTNFTLYLYDTSLKSLLGSLSKLEVLHLVGVNISLNGNEWDKSVFKVSSNLKELSMAGGGLSGNFPEEIFHLTNLTELALGGNPLLSGQLPEFTKQSFLQYLFLEYTNFTGPLPDSIGNLQYLSELDLSNCNFYGEIPPSIANLTRLELLELWSNRLTGTIPLSLFSHPSLRYLDLSYNQFSGYLPEFSNGSSILESISLDSNNLQGELPISIFKFPQLSLLSLASNNFNGTLNLDVIQHSKKLEDLYLSNNKLSIVEGKNHNESFYASFHQISYLSLASCNLTKFPSFLNYLANIYSLNLSNNSLTGEIPLSICNMTYLKLLDLSYNNLTGTVPPCLLEDTQLEVLYLKRNKLNGPMPQNISKACGLVIINLNGNVINGSLPKLLKYCNALEVLDMGNNRIVSRFPYWLGNLENLRVLVLKSNMFYGEISDIELKPKGSDYVFPMLKVLDLSTNHFNGTLPRNLFVNLKAMMGVSNTSSLNYYFDLNVSYTPYVVSITYKGQSFDLKKSIGIFGSIDLSMNEFLGEIPEEIGQLLSLDVVNLSHNALTGPIPSKFANLHQLQLLDLSSNQLSGHIPQELASLTFLSALNLSYNNLVGEIPEARQFSTFSNASYLGNPGLCGSPLSLQCPTPSSNQGFNKGLPLKSSADIIGISVSIGLGLGVGFAFVIWATMSWENDRKWFNFIIDRFYIRHFH